MSSIRSSDWLLKKDRYAYGLIIPSLIVLFVVLFVPLLFSFYVSWFKWSLVGDVDKHFVGISNFVKLLTDAEVINSLRVTFIFVSVSIALEFALGIPIALLLNRPFKGCNLVRVIIFIPMMLSPTVVALMWRLILHAERGILNYILSFFGVGIIVWVGSKLALPTLIFIEVWMQTPFVILMVLAGLQAIPVHIIEASRVDGVNRWQQLVFIELPMIQPVLLVALIFRTMFALRNFPLPWVLTKGGPGNATNVMGIELYRRAFRYFEMGSAAALSWILVAVTAVVSLVYIKMMTREAVE